MARQPQPEQPTVIRSADNQTIKLVRSLRQRKMREAERLFVVEGIRLVDEALARGLRPKALLFREDRVDLVDQLSGSGSRPLEYRVVEPTLFDSVAETVTPQGVLAVLPIPDQSIPERDIPLIVVADQIRDPGNLGTLIRVTAGAGATAVVMTEGTVDPYNSKVVRSAMGAHFQIPLLWLDDETADWIRDACPNRVLADADGERVYDDIDWTVSSTLIVGPETGGFSEEARNLANAIARIPLTGEIESLNAGIAGAVMLFEANRQRRAVPPALGRDKGKD